MSHSQGFPHDDDDDDDKAVIIQYDDYNDNDEDVEDMMNDPYQMDDEMDTNVDERQRLLDKENSRSNARLTGSGRSVQATTYEDALLMCGYGRFHIMVLILCGWAVSSDAIEVLSVSFLLPTATCDLNLSSSDKGWLNAVVFLGMMVGGYLWGAMADKSGRRSILMWSLLVNGLGNLCSCVVQTFYPFLLCRFVSGIGVGGSMPVVFTYFTEFQPKHKRGAMISLLATFWMMGNIVAAGLAWIVIPREYLSFESGEFTFHSWRVFVALCTIPSLTSAAMFVLMPESPKFLLDLGKEEEAISVLKHVHAANNSSHAFKVEALVLTDDQVSDEAMGDFVSSNRPTSKWTSFKQYCSKMADATSELFRKNLRRTTCILLIINFTLAFGYYGLFLWFPELFDRIDKYGGTICNVQTGNDTSSDNSTCSVPSNEVFVESFLTSISNLPGNILSILIVEKVGRKSLLASSMVLSGISVFLLLFVEKTWQSVLCSCIFGAISVIGFNMLDVLQTELFPTHVRSTAFGLQTAFARVGAILGNIAFGELVDANCFIPMVLVASLLAFGGLSGIALPNTTGIDIH